MNNLIVWHRQTKPSKEGMYLVSIHFDAIGDRVDTEYWDGDEWENFNTMVYAWAELPKPAYRPNPLEEDE